MARSIGVFFLLSLPLSLCLRFTSPMTAASRILTSPMAAASRILTSPMAAAEPYEDAGSNRKIRRRPLRRAAETPYDRPAAAIQGLRIQSAAAVAERNGWISKIFQPAMRIIARSASHIFPSMFQTPLPPPPEAAGMTDPCTDESEVACTNPSPKAWKPCSSDAVNLVNNSSPDGAQRILNSDANGISELEILLKQKTFTRSEFDRLTELFRSRTIEPSSWQPTVIYEKGEANVSGQENENDTRSNLNIPTPALSLRNQLFREDNQNGHMLPRPIGRTTMHKMSRSPYFKAASATNIKVHDLGSPGPIRRLRQKSNLISLSKDIQWPHGNRLPDPSTTLQMDDFDLGDDDSSQTKLNTKVVMKASATKRSC